MSEEKSTPAAKPVKTEWQHANWVSELGKWVWLIGFIGGIAEIIYGLLWFLPLILFLPFAIGNLIWYIISGFIAIIISIAIIKPKVSNKCAQKDWDHFYNWVWKLGNFRFPFILFWGIILEIFGWGWAGIPVIIIAVMLIFLGPKQYQWSE